MHQNPPLSSARSAQRHPGPQWRLASNSDVLPHRYHRCPYILFAGVYSFGTKVIDRNHHAVKEVIRTGRPCCTHAEFEAAKLVICVGVYLSIVLAYVFSLRVRRGPLVVTWACGGACGHLHPRRARYRPVAYESDEEETATTTKTRGSRAV